MQTNDNNKITATKCFTWQATVLSQKPETSLKNIKVVKRNEKKNVEKMQTNDSNKNHKIFCWAGHYLMPSTRDELKNINLVKRNEKNKVEKMQTNNNN
jgi:hypothetical protein